ncbi:MAG: trigger factor [Oscillibacter ruminantium]|uniref:trigger factor n=1 Tax=Oscillibacter ruminantium TaxID=1263547 RepID=UPI002B218C9A|nr:trigger factor [Oscillibacter ruminantium]MEA5041615.1 trigger factor [Oscillibacter ruminantium]
MNVKNCENQEKSTVALTVEVSGAEFEAAIVKAYQKMRKKINVPGFRPGKAPQKIIEGMYGAEVFYEEAVNIAMPDAYEAAVAEKKLEVVGYPQVELEGELTKDGFTFKAIVPVYPEVKLGEYKGLKAPKTPAKVSAADVDDRLKEMAERNTRLVSADREAKNGDVAVIDFEGFLDGTPFDGGKGENHNLELGTGSFVPGFEEQVVGMKAGDEKDVNITFPADYTPELAGKDVVFKVKLHEVKEKDVPAMDDEFAKDVSEFDTLKELKADIKKKITEEREDAAQQTFEDNLMQQVAENITADVPDAMVDAQARRFLDNFKNQIQQQGIPYDQYLKMTGMDESKLLEDAKEPALRQVRLDLALAAIIKEEKIEISDEDVENEYKTMAEKYSIELENVKKYLPAEQIKDQLSTRKAIDLVTESATATAPKAEDDEEKPAKKITKKSAEDDEEKPAKKTAAKKTAKAEDGEEKPAKKPAAKKTAKKTEE